MRTVFAIIAVLGALAFAVVVSLPIICLFVRTIWEFWT